MQGSTLNASWAKADPWSVCVVPPKKHFDEVWIMSLIEAFVGFTILTVTGIYMIEKP